MDTDPILRPKSPSRDGLRNVRGLLEGIAAGAVYGVFLRGFVVIQTALQKPYSMQNPKVAQHQVGIMDSWNAGGEVMTFAFLLLGPFLIGLLTVRRMEARHPFSSWTWIVAPWLAVVCMMVVVALFAWEGAICVLMALPITLILSSLGGIAGGLLSRRRWLSKGNTLSFALLPFLLAPAESLLPAPVQTRTVSSEIRIHAARETVWKNIRQVSAISPAELRPNWTHRIGFPRPVEATLSHEGVGGVRHATFEHGLLFVETITGWEPEHRLAFSIRADTANIPPTTLDEHVTIGGPYFDVLDGEYRLESLANGEILLHLVSHQRLSTDFNGYAGLCSDVVMQSLQTSILQVIQHRCETRVN